MLECLHTQLMSLSTQHVQLTTLATVSTLTSVEDNNACDRAVVSCSVSKSYSNESCCLVWVKQLQEDEKRSWDELQPSGTKGSGAAPCLLYSPRPPTAYSVICTYYPTPHSRQRPLPSQDGGVAGTSDRALAKWDYIHWIHHVHCMHAENLLPHCCDEVELIIIRLVCMYMHRSTYVFSNTTGLQEVLAYKGLCQTCTYLRCITSTSFHTFVSCGQWQWFSEVTLSLQKGCSMQRVCLYVHTTVLVTRTLRNLYVH